MNNPILSLIASRLLIAVVTLIIVSFAVFFATTMLPGDTASILLGQAATPEAVEGLRKTHVERRNSQVLQKRRVVRA